MNKLNALFDKKWFRIVLLAVIIAAELTYTIYLFANEKHGQHSDEVWTYSIANDSKQFDFQSPDIMNRWQTPDAIREYMTVQPEEAFRFGATYRNSEHDLNPPLYYLIIHFICSFFPNQYSPWYAFSVNIVALIATFIFLYMLSALCFRGNRFMPFVVVLFYAVCRGSDATFVFMRMYAMMTALTVANLYYQVRVLQHEGKGLWKPALGSFITCYLGFMTHSFFPVVGGIATFMVCLWFLCTKQIKKCFAYGGVMLGSLALYALTFPKGITHVFAAGDAAQTAGATYPFRTQFMTLLSATSWHILGTGFSIFKDYGHIYATVALVALIALAVPLCFLFRNETWFKRFVSGIKNFCISFIKEKKLWKTFDYPFVLVLCVFITYLVVGSKVINAAIMGAPGARYVFCLFPLGALLVTMAVYFVFSHIKPVKHFAVLPSAVLAMLPAINAFVMVNNVFLFSGIENYVDGYELYRGQRVEIYLPTNWLCVPFMPYLLECEEIRFVTPDAVLSRPDYGIDTSVTKDGSLYLLLPYTEEMENDVDSSVMSAFSSVDPKLAKSADKRILGEINMVGNVDKSAVDDEKVKEIMEQLREREDVHEIEYVCDMFNQMYYTHVYKIS